VSDFHGAMGLFDFGFGTQLILVFDEFLLVQLLGDLRLDVFQFWGLGFTHVV
jgi:hypothetical protein